MIRRAAALAAFSVVSAPGLPHAQVPPERTGPRADPPALPAFPTPVPSIAPTTAAAPSSAPVVTAPGVAPLTSLSIEGDEGRAVPPRDWRPPDEPGADLKLEHAPGQPLDAAWVRRQYELNGLAQPGAPLERALALVQLLNRAYLNAGFINSGLIVERSPAPGALALRIVHGGLVAPDPDTPALSVAWTDAHPRGLGPGYVRDRMPAAQARPLSAVDLERDFRLLAEDPAIRTINADLRPGRRPGEASLAITVLPQDRFDIYVQADNSRSPSVGGERLAMGGLVRNLAVSGDLLSGEFGLTRGLEDAAVSYVTPFLTPRMLLSVRGALNNAAVIDRELAPLDIEARDRSGEVGVAREIIDRPLLPKAEGGWKASQTLTAGVAVSHRISTTTLLGERFSFSPGSENGRTRYTALRFTGDYILRDIDQVAAVSVTGVLGLDGTRSDTPGVPTPKKHFKSLLVQGNYARKLSASGLELRARAAGQFADSVLYSGERISAGGETTVRGYRENLLLADRGVVGSVELAHPLRIGGDAGRQGMDWGAFAVSAFADAAYLRNKAPPQPVSEIYSVGVAVAWAPSEAINARVTYGEALKTVRASGEKDLQDRGVHFRVTLYPLRFR